MKASELRIGNWLNDGFFDFQVEVQDILIISDMPEGLNIKPIPLTEEWLMKFGFIQEHCCNGKYERWNKDCVYIEKINHVFHHDFISIGAIHQLQNLYFALTGEELQLNLQRR